MKRGFSLIEMLVVIGIIAVLIGASIGGYSAMTRMAEKARCQELVSNVATALTAIYEQEGVWPKRLIKNGEKDGKLDAEAALAFVTGVGTKYLSLSINGNRTKLTGHDRFGVLSPWAANVVKKLGTGASLGSTVTGKSTIDDHILHYALDLDGDGKIIGASVGGADVNVRANAIVWCCGKDGVIDPYPYGDKGGGKRGKNTASGKRSDDVYSWTPGQARDVGE